MGRPKPDMRSHLDNYETCSPGDMRAKEVCRQGHGQKDLEKALPAERGGQTLSFPTRQRQGVVFSVWVHIWNQPDAHCKELMRPAPIAKLDRVPGHLLAVPGSSLAWEIFSFDTQDLAPQGWNPGPHIGSAAS